MNVIGRCKSIDGQKQKPENGCFTGFLASPARFERAAPRLGGINRPLCRVIQNIKKSKKSLYYGIF